MLVSAFLPASGGAAAFVDKTVPHAGGEIKVWVTGDNPKHLPISQKK
jgi:hypothetical protein